MNIVINRKTLISMLFIAMSMLGYISYKKLSLELYPVPETQSMTVMVSTRVNVDPQYMEMQAIIPLEGAIGQLEGVDEISSTASNKNGVITITYREGVNLKYAYLRLQEKINEEKSDLSEEFTVTLAKNNTNSLSNEFMHLQVLGEGGEDYIRNIVDEEVTTLLENIDGIASVNVYGGSSKSVDITISEEVAKMYNLTANRLSRLLQQGQVDRTCVGSVSDGGKQFMVNVSAEYEDVSDLQNVIVKTQGPVLLKDIAEISFSTQEKTSYSRVNGKELVSILLVNDNSVNIIDLSHKTREVIEQLNRDLASVGVSIMVNQDTAETMEKNIDQIMWLAIVGGLLAIIILWYFLRNIRLVMAIALAMPISIFSSFNLFYAYGITVNSLTLVGMALAIGMLIDNSVVVLENIYRLRAEGKSIRDAVLQGTKEVWKSIFAATLTTICVFVPFLFTQDVVTKLYGTQIGVSIVATLIISFLAATLFVPMATHFLLSRRKDRSQLQLQKLSTRSRIVQVYVLLLKSSMRRPATVIISAVLVFFIVLLTVISKNTNNLSELETNQFQVYVTMPVGSTLEATDELIRQLEDDLLLIEEQESVSSKVEEETGILTLLLKDDYEKINNRNLLKIKAEVEQIMKKYKDLADLDFEQSSSNERFAKSGGQGKSQQMERMMGMGTKSESIVISGEDYELMSQVAEDIEYYVGELDEVSKVRSSQSREQPEVHVEFDGDIMERNSISLTEVNSELSSFKKEIESGYKFTSNNQEYDIIIRLDTMEEIPPNTMLDLEELEIENTEGAIYELQTLSRLVYSSGISRISRVNQQKEITLSITFNTEYNEDKDLLLAARTAVDDIIALLPIPADVSVEVIHEEDSYKEVYIIVGLAILLIFMILASVFESFSTPVVLLFSIPLAAIGSLIALLITGNQIQNLNTLTGFIILLGVVVNNGIILIDYANILQKRGYRRSRALIIAGISRMRPIFITAITTIVALLPLALGHSEYVGTIGAPFAITVIGGLAVSTILTLVFIPTFYFGLENVLAWFGSLKTWIKLVQIGLFTVSVILIYTEMNDLLFQIVTLIVTVVCIPAATWFILHSLKKANDTIIPADDPIVINIQNLVKVYDRDGRFSREWKAGKAIRQHFEEAKVYKKLIDIQSLSWQIPVLSFVVYMAVLYLTQSFWIFVLLLVAYFFIRHIFHLFEKLFVDQRQEKKSQIMRRISKLWLWVGPLCIQAFLYSVNNNMGGVIVILLLWYLALTINHLSDKLRKDKVNVNRLSGRFAKLRRLVYLFVLSIPIIGKKNTPFKALKGVSLEIGQGMYGLLGPNGAGKSTLMRIICGIYEQSYGKVFFNGIDTQEKREELQGLIGYLPQEFGMYENMTSWEYLNYQSILKKITDKEVRQTRVEQVLRAVHMWENKDKKIGSFSGGMKQRIGIAQVLLHLPRVLVVDEPTAGLDPRERIRFRNLLIELSRKRIVIFSTHIIEDISSSCNKLAVLKQGEVEYVGSPAEMSQKAKGHVWNVIIPADEFEAYATKLKVIHHLREGDMIRLRFLAKEKPMASATPCEPNLEDAYLWLQQRNVN